jgi:hypothetical protein
MEDCMKYGVRVEVPGLTAERYSGMHSIVGPKSLATPGFIFHLAGPTQDGWYMIDVWESKEEYDRFMRDVIMPMMPPGGPQPKVEEFEVHTFEVS